MATRRTRTSATRKTAKTASITKESAPIVDTLSEKKVTTKPRASVKKVTTTAPKRVNKVTQPEAIKVTEVTNTPKIATPSNTKSLLKDYPRDIFALFLLPLFYLEAGTKEVLKYAGVLA
jgi:hypothetical protein